MFCGFNDGNDVSDLGTEPVFPFSSSATVEKAFLGQAEQSQFYRIPPLLQKSGFQYIFDVNIRYFWADSF